MSAKPEVYLGDTTLNTAASYLGGVMTQDGIDFIYVPSGRRVKPAVVAPERKLFIVSDFSATHFPSRCSAVLFPKSSEARACS